MSENKKSNKKKPYKKPKLKDLGRISEISQTKSTGGKADGGVAPYNQKMCLTEPRAIEEYRHLTADSFVQQAYRKAIAKGVKKGDVVLDLGTGTGIHTLFALQAGAKHVYAIDSMSVIENAKDAIEENGFAGKVTFINDHFEKLVLPQKVDVIISNLGFFGSFQNLPEVSQKFLKPDGKMIPDAMNISFAPVDYEQFHSENIGFWKQNHYGFKFSSLESMAALSPHYLHLDADHFAAPEYSSKLMRLNEDACRHAEWNFEFNVPAGKSIHGIGGWYTFYFEGEEMFSTRPPNSLGKALWNNFLLPVSVPKRSSEEMNLTCSVRFRYSPEHQDSIWHWDIQGGEKSLH